MFILLVGWCFTHGRVDYTLAALGVYLGLLDGYLKLSTGSSTITLARDLLVIAIAGGALFRAARTQARLALPPLGGLVVGFGAVVLIELVNPSMRGLAAGLAGVRQHLEFVPLFFLGFAFMRRRTHIEWFLLLVVVCAAAGGVVSYLQSTLTPQELAAWGPGYAQRILGTDGFSGAGRIAFDAAGASVRPFGLGSDAGAGGVAAALALPGLIALAMGGTMRMRLALLPLAGGLALAIATAGSRAALVTVFVSVVAFGLIAAASRNAVRAVVGLAVGTMILFFVFQHLAPSNSATKRARSAAPTEVVSTFTSERGTSVQAFGSLASSYPLGAGVGSAGPASGIARDADAVGYNSETQWNFLVVETGLAGLAIYLMLNLRLIALSLTRIRRVTESKLRLNLAAVAAPLCGLLIAGFAGPTTATVPGAPYLWLAAGILSYWLVRALDGGAGGHAQVRR